MPYGIYLQDKNIDLEVALCKECNFVYQSSAYTAQYDINIKKLYASYKIFDMYNFPNRNYHHLKALEFLNGVVKNHLEYNVLEIGSNRGDFLYLLKESYPNINILGCEPTEFKNLKIPTINTFFDKQLFNTKFDLIILRHTLEHIKYPKKIVNEFTSLLKEDGKVFIEVPNIVYSLKNYLEDFTPDHVNYFHTDSLIDVFSKFFLENYDDKEYIYALFSNRQNKKNIYIKQEIDIKSLFKSFINNINSCINDVCKFKRVIFYGIGNYYLWTFQKMKNYLEDKELFFMDDFKEKDDIYNLPKANLINQDDLVILCSSNTNIQDNMKRKLPKNTKVLVPYKGIESV
jgi:SAM-dependent methyltransferase